MVPKEIDQFVVEQEHGKDSTVWVYELSANTWAGPRDWLIYVSDQSLKSNSGRAWDVNRAIEKHAQPQGFESTSPQSVNEDLSWGDGVSFPDMVQSAAKGNYWNHIATFVYSPDAHSRITAIHIKDDIQNHPDYVAAFEKAEQQAQEIKDTTGRLIATINKMVQKLEKETDQELTRLNIELLKVQKQLVDKITFPDHLSKYDRDHLTTRPVKTIKTDVLADFRYKIIQQPLVSLDDIEQALAAVYEEWINSD